MLQRVLNDQKTLTGKNAELILKSIDSSDIMEVKVNDVKKNLKFAKIEEKEKYRIKFIREISNLKNNVLDFYEHEDQFNDDELNDILNYVSSS